MLVNDNEDFQQLAENLKQTRHCLEEELKTQREQHVKATKELENEHCGALDEADKYEDTLSALKTDYSQLLDKCKKESAALSVALFGRPWSTGPSHLAAVTVLRDQSLN
ncbi:hypothetical protein IscW_ISCW000671 [Ixodes scapularis]|uniref:Uncharacterized protein n=1 Tax=Ixodes scapularis TaxID=6945 RepID=B7P1Y9_IXOSC|nr:hypothetical protein IscW_ISCW000671 [Ixodes scapularis]|eukprot:XP_002401090.1 hypothetical protein IscW_ISCW000671 [Ixodes scapularis]